MQSGSAWSYLLFTCGPIIPAKHRDGRHSMCLREFKGHKKRVTALALTADDKTLFSASHDGGVRSWVASTGQCLLIMLGSHATPNIQALALSPCGRFVFSSGTDGTLVRWCAFDGGATHELRAHALPVCALAVAAGEGLVLSSSYDGSVRAWRRDPAAHLSFLALYSTTVGSLHPLITAPLFVFLHRRFAPPERWSRARHRSFPRGFRDAVRTFLLCVYRGDTVVSASFDASQFPAC